MYLSDTGAKYRLDGLAIEHSRKDFASIFVHHTVGEALAHIRRHPPKGRFVYFYVVDEEKKLQGVVPTRRLLLNSPETRVTDIMVRKVITIPATATVLDACEYFILHRLLAFPVVDAENRILGVIDVDLYTDELAELDARSEQDDVFQLIGVHLEQVRQAAVPVAFARRFPWLLCNIGGGIACAFLASLYQDLLDQFVVLALFIPVVLALAESVSIQSLTLAIQSQQGRRFGWSASFRSVRRELGTSLLLGLASGLLVAAVAWIWQQHRAVAACILASIAMAMMTGASLGLIVPIVLRSIQRDPKVAAGPITLAMTDIACLFYYFSLAVWLLR
jgi:magnesium transporter